MVTWFRRARSASKDTPEIFTGEITDMSSGSLIRRNRSSLCSVTAKRKL